MSRIETRNSPTAAPPDRPRRSWIVPFAVVGLSVAIGWGARRLHGPAGANSAPTESPVSAAHVSPTILSRAALLYQLHCAKCHGPEGRGDGEAMARLRPPPRDFAERPWKHDTTFESIRRVIADGIPGTSMAAQRAALAPDELDLLAGYVLHMVEQLPVMERALTPEQQQLAALGFEIARPQSTSPNLKIEDASGRSLTLAGTKGAWVLLEFWGMSCEPCRATLPALQRLSRSGIGERLKIIPVCADADDARTAQEALSEIAPGLTGWIDATGIGVSQFGVQALPMAWLIDPEGLVQATHVGCIDWDSPEVREILEGILYFSGRQN
jgi:mono/diheme cytochrome c family protein